MQDSDLIPQPGWHHRDHLRLAWVLVRQYDQEEALREASVRLRSFAARLGNVALYNEALTRFWMERVAQAVMEHPEISDFDAFLEACPHLLDKNLPDRCRLPENKPDDVGEHPEHAE